MYQKHVAGGMLLATLTIVGIGSLFGGGPVYAGVHDVDAGGAIPAVDTSGTSVFTFTVTGEGPIFDLDVRFSAQHTWVDDLDVTLTSPSNTTVTLFTDVGGGGDNFQDTLLDDEATANIAAGIAPFVGSYTPENEWLTAFDGEPANGIWTLTVEDDFVFDSGTLFKAGDTAPWGTAVGTQLIFASISANTNLERLWPPNKKLVRVDVSGTITNGDDIIDAWLEVSDEYDELDATYDVSLDSNGNYLVSPILKAARKGRDYDGRIYTITVYAVDPSLSIGASDPLAVIVAPDQNKK